MTMTMTMKTLDRRDALKAMLGLGGAGLLASQAGIAGVLGAACGLTPAQTEGPFFPIVDQPDKDNDLTFVKGGRGKALGDVIYVTGTVTDESCAPVAGALVEIWQACASGRYNHPDDTNPAPLDPNFQYWGRATTGAGGGYAFKTILPGDYPAEPGWMRPSHIHFKVHGRGFHELTTQLYFEGNPLNARDKVLRGVPGSQRARVVVPLRPVTSPEMEPGTRVCQFDLAIQRVL